MSRTIYITVAVLLLVSSGLLHGKWTHRWSTDAEFNDKRFSTLNTLPMAIGEWTGEELTLNPEELRLTEARSSVIRRYVHRTRGTAVTVVLLGGRPGPISVHTPDICYRGSGYEEMTEAVRMTLSDAAHDEFWVRNFRKPSATPVQLRIFHSWSSDGRWEAPEHPRFAFAGQPALFKLYLIREMARPSEPTDDDLALDLFRTLRPKLVSILSNASSRAG
jgi:hypothetical protein